MRPNRIAPAEGVSAHSSGIDVEPIYLVGVGSASVGLLTLRGAEVLRAATLLLYDDGIGEDVLALAEGAEARAVGALDAEAVARLAMDAAATVARVYRGDVLTSARGAAELRALRRLGAAVEVVPGVPPEVAALAYVGVGVAAGQTVELVRLEGGAAGADGGVLVSVRSGGGGGGGGGARGGVVVWVRWAAAGASAAAALLGAGSAPETPAALVEFAGTPRQSVRISTLGALAEGAAGGAGVPAGSVLVAAAGEALAQRARWFEGRPLFGRRIVVTRPRAQARGLVAWLASQGAEPVPFPAIRIVPPPDPGPLAAAAAEVRGYDWVVFTSVNGVERFWAALSESGLDTRALGRAKVAAIGPATAEALVARGVVPDVVPPRYVAESVVEALAGEELRGRRVLLPRAAGARDVLPVRLREMGADVTEVEAYRSVPDVGAAAELRARIDAGEIDAITFTSSSTVSNFVEAVGADAGRAVVACIGPVTAATAEQLGLRVGVVAEDHTVPGLQRALSRHFAGS